MPYSNSATKCCNPGCEGELTSKRQRKEATRSGGRCSECIDSGIIGPSEKTLLWNAIRERDCRNIHKYHFGYESLTIGGGGGVLVRIICPNGVVVPTYSNWRKKLLTGAGGKVDAGEVLADAIDREWFEETIGMLAGKIEYKDIFFMAGGKKEGGWWYLNVAADLYTEMKVEEVSKICLRLTNALNPVFHIVMAAKGRPSSAPSMEQAEALNDAWGKDPDILVNVEEITGIPVDVIIDTVFEHAKKGELLTPSFLSKIDKISEASEIKLISPEELMALARAQLEGSAHEGAMKLMTPDAVVHILGELGY